MKISVPVEDPINISEEVKRCGVWKTVNSSNELAEKTPHKRHSKKRKTSGHKSRKNPKLSEIEEESFLKASQDHDDENEDDAGEHSEFITINIDKADHRIDENAAEEDTAEAKV